MPYATEWMPYAEEEPYVITVRSVTKPVTAKWGAFIWPVVFELDHESNADNGGWILQHITGQVTDTTIPDYKDLDRRLDYWEAFRVAPHSTSPKRKEVDDNLLRGFNRLGVDLEGITANDWYGFLPRRGHSVKFNFEGDLYYIDNLGEKGLPPSWKTDYKPTGGLPGIETKGHEKEINEFLETYGVTKMTPVKHCLTVVCKRNTATIERHVP
jgi:hypothetical protein